MNFPPKTLVLTTLLCFIISFTALAKQTFTPKDLLELKYIGSFHLSPDGSEVIYSVSIPRGPNEEAGKAHKTYYHLNIQDGENVPLFKEGIKVSGIQWHPQDEIISFLLEKKGEPTQVWVMNKDAEMKQITFAANDVEDFKWNPKGGGLAYRSETPKSDKRKRVGRAGLRFYLFRGKLKEHTFILYGSE